MCKKVYVVMSHFAGHSKIEGVFSCYEYAEKFRELENSKLEEFRKQDESFTIESYKIDCLKVPEDQCYKKYWDYVIKTNKDIQDYGTITYVGSDKELVHVNKLQDVEVYDGEYIYCRSYISKQECEQIAHEQWQMFEQKELCKQGA